MVFIPCLSGLQAFIYIKITCGTCFKGKYSASLESVKECLKLGCKHLYFYKALSDYDAMNHGLHFEKKHLIYLFYKYIFSKNKVASDLSHSNFCLSIRKAAYSILHILNLKSLLIAKLLFKIKRLGQHCKTISKYSHNLPNS